MASNTQALEAQTPIVILGGWLVSVRCGPVVQWKIVLMPKMCMGAATTVSVTYSRACPIQSGPCATVLLDLLHNLEELSPR